MLVFCAGQRAELLKSDLVEGRDFICYEQVPTRPGDIICRNGRWVDRRTTDGEILAADGRNAI